MYYVQVVLGFQWTALGPIHGKLPFLHMCKGFGFVETTMEVFSHYSLFLYPFSFRYSHYAYVVMLNFVPQVS